MARLNVDGARCEAPFASELQRPDAPTADSVTEAISRTVRRLGTRGCAGRMAQESGDHPQAAAGRMRWIRQLATGTTTGRWRASARSRLAGPGGRPPASCLSRASPKLRGSSPAGTTGGTATPADATGIRNVQYCCGYPGRSLASQDSDKTSTARRGATRRSGA